MYSQLVGSAEYFIVNGTVDPIIPGVNVTDGDPNYSGNFTLATNATADATNKRLCLQLYVYSRCR